MPQEKLRTQPAPLRCPFCHEGIEVEAEDWVVCSGCLGRHHASCWGESGNCSSCQATTCLKSEDVALEPVEQPRAEPTEDLIRILDAHEHSSEGSVLDYFLSPVTLGLYPFLVNEKRLIRHAERNREALGDDEDARLKRYRAEALDDVQKGAKRRMEFGIVLLPILLALASAGAWAISEVILGTRAASEELGAALILGSLVVWIFSQLGLLASHWGAVRRHESKQLYLGLLARGTSEDEARRLLAEHQAVWRKQGGIFAGITAVLCFPTPAAFLLPFWLARAWRQPLDVHKDREANVPELFPRRVGKKGSPTPADPEAEEDLGPVG